MNQRVLYIHGLLACGVVVYVDGLDVGVRQLTQLSQ